MKLVNGVEVMQRLCIMDNLLLVIQICFCVLILFFKYALDSANFYGRIELFEDLFSYRMCSATLPFDVF